MAVRNSYSESDDLNLIEYIALHNPSERNRTGNNLYKSLVAKTGKNWKWVQNHPWQSWRHRYKSNQPYFDREIKKYLRKSQKLNEERLTGGSISKTGKETRGPNAGLGSSSRRVDEEPENAESASDDVYRELFGSFDESDSQSISTQEGVDAIDTSSQSDSSSDSSSEQPVPAPKPPIPVVRSSSDSGTEQPKRKQPTLSSQSNSSSDSEPEQRVPKPRPKVQKRIESEEDPFGTPPSTPFHAIKPKGNPPTIIEGPFRNILKRGRPINDVDDSWPPKRKQKLVNDQLQTKEVPVQKPTVPPAARRPQHVNAVASSSKVKLPDPVLRPKTNLQDIVPSSTDDPPASRQMSQTKVQDIGRLQAKNHITTKTTKLQDIIPSSTDNPPPSRQIPLTKVQDISANGRLPSKNLINPIPTKTTNPPNVIPSSPHPPSRHIPPTKVQDIGPLQSQNLNNAIPTKTTNPPNAVPSTPLPPASLIPQTKVQDIGGNGRLLSKNPIPTKMTDPPNVVPLTPLPPSSHIPQMKVQDIGANGLQSKNPIPTKTTNLPNVVPSTPVPPSSHIPQTKVQDIGANGRLQSKHPIPTKTTNLPNVVPSTPVPPSSHIPQAKGVGANGRLQSKNPTPTKTTNLPNVVPSTSLPPSSHIPQTNVQDTGADGRLPSKNLNEPITTKATNPPNIVPSSTDTPSHFSSHIPQMKVQDIGANGRLPPKDLSKPITQKTAETTATNVPSIPTKTTETTNLVNQKRAELFSASAPPLDSMEENDPFVSNKKLEKETEKVIQSKQPPRIDLHKQSRSKRLNNDSTSSRRSSVLSSISDFKLTKKPRLSDSLRHSISGLSDDQKFVHVAVQSTANELEGLANRYGVSAEIAMKTYTNTRSLEKTKFILEQYCRILHDAEQDIFSRMPDLHYHSDAEEESDSEDEIPSGLKPAPQPPRKKVRAHEPPSPPPAQQQQKRTTRSNRPSLNIKPLLDDDDRFSDYSPPGSSRAGQYARLVKQGRKDEALAREKRRVSGSMTSSSQKRALKPIGQADVTPTPLPRSGNGVVPMDVDPVVESAAVEDDDDDIYVRAEDERPARDDELGEAVDYQDDFFSASKALSKRILKGKESIPELRKLAEEHRGLAMNVCDDNVEEMERFEAANNPDLLRFMSLKLAKMMCEENATS